MKLTLNTNKELEIREYNVMKNIVLQGRRYNEGPTSSLFTEDTYVTLEKKEEEKDEKTEKEDKTEKSKIIAKVLRTNIKKDGKRSCHNPLDHYFIKSAGPLYKTDLELDNEGRISDILNRSEILQSWEYTKIYLDRYFVSDDRNIIETIKGWTEYIDGTVKDDMKFLDAVNNDLFYNQFFSGYWIDYGEENTLYKNQRFPGLFGQSKVVLTEELTFSGDELQKTLSVNGYLNKEDSDMKAIANFLNLEEEDLDDLSISLEGNYIFDEAGIPTQIDIYADAHSDGCDFKKQYGITVKSK